MEAKTETPGIKLGDLEAIKNAKEWAQTGGGILGPVIVLDLCERFEAAHGCLIMMHQMLCKAMDAGLILSEQQ